MISLHVWLPGPMFLHVVSVFGPMFLPGVFVQGVSVWGSLSRGGFCPGDLCSKGDLCLGDVCQTNCSVKSGSTHPTGMLSCHACYMW